jgi:outer membrane usher protein
MRRTSLIAAVTAILAWDPASLHAAESGNAMWVTVRINGTEQTSPALIEIHPDGAIHAPVVATESWRLPRLAIPHGAMDSSRGMVRLNTRPGFDAQLDERQGQLDLVVAPWLYDAQIFALGRAQEPLRAAPLAMMVDYDLYATSDGHASGALDTSLGAGRVSLGSTWQAGHAAGGGLQRLETALRISFPEQMASLGLGDAIGAAMTATRAVRFTGLQWSSDYTTQPDFLPFALPAAEGVAVVPSTVDLFVNGSFVATRTVDPGPFAVHDVPVPVGSGEVELRIRDSMGREQRVTRRFLATPQLLRPGLVAHSLELGAMRRDFGLREADYGPGFAAFSLRRGMSAGTTLAAGAELLANQGTVRAEAVQSLSGADLLSIGIAAGGRFGSAGLAGDLSWQHRRSNFEWGTQLRVMERAYVDMGRDDSGTSMSLASQLSFRLARRTGISLIHALRRETGQRAIEVLTLSASSGPVAGGSVHAYLTRSSGSSGDVQAGLYYSLALGPVSTGLGFVQDGRRSSASVRAGRNADRHAGWGWDASAHTGDNAYQALRLQTQGSRGGSEVQLMSHRKATTAAAAWHGGVILQSRSIHLAPALGESAAVVELPGLADIPVYHDGLLLGRTDARGRLVAPELRSYELNRFLIKGNEVPIATWLAADSLQLRPYSRNVYRLQFATRLDWAEFLLTLPDGSPVPAGARVDAGDEPAMVGEAGLIAAPLAPGRSLRVHWTGGTCSASPGPAQIAAAIAGPVPLECR